MSERCMRQPSRHGAPRSALAAAAMAVLIRGDDATFDDGTIIGEVLAGGDKAQGVQTGEGRQIGALESRVGHVEVFCDVGVGTSIIRRPQRLSALRHADGFKPGSQAGATPSIGKSQLRPPRYSTRGSPLGSMSSCCPMTRSMWARRWISLAASWLIADGGRTSCPWGSRRLSWRTSTEWSAQWYPRERLTGCSFVTSCSSRGHWGVRVWICSSVSRLKGCG